MRLVITPATDGPMNMAIDQAIMEAVAQERVPRTLRFFAWEPACLSLGYMQPLSDSDQDRLAARGWDIVRRMTGGRAILHVDELTYSVACKAGDPLVAGSIVESYRRLSGALLHGLNILGADADANKRAKQSGGTIGPVCFEVPSRYEITFSGKKLIGSAQVRKMGAVLQHGTLPLTGDITRICDGLVFPDDQEREIARQRVASRATTLEEVLHRIISWEDAIQAMRRGFEETFDLTFEIADSLTPEELQRAEELRALRYAHDEWTGRF
ncbi:MAG: lipoate--protein ligase family protein [Anaerolineae bacterium]|nr:lipoate--protein ligase family protein [Anaerolineae bacterium]